MKTRPLLFAVSVAMMLRVPYCVGQSNVVFYGANSNSLGVAFVDTTLSVPAKSAIVSDLQLCLRVWGKKSELIIGADEPDLAGYLNNSDTSPHYPEEIKFPGNVVNGPNGLALQIPKALSDAYTNAFAFVAANSNIVAAAYEFVAFISSGNLASMSSNALPNYILFKNALADANAESNAIVRLAPRIIPDLCYQTYYTPSALGFYYSPEGPSATNLWLNIPCSTLPSSMITEWSGMPVLWHGGRWVFCLWEDWMP
jgi:hypothetical protein